jgi:hypothetical protein
VALGRSVWDTYTTKKPQKSATCGIFWNPLGEDFGDPFWQRLELFQVAYRRIQENHRAISGRVQGGGLIFHLLGATLVLGAFVAPSTKGSSLSILSA